MLFRSADVKEAAIGRREDGMLVTDPAQEARLAELESAVERARQALKAVTPAMDAAQAEWEASVSNGATVLAELRPGAKASTAAARTARSVAAILVKPAAERGPKERQAVRDYFLANVESSHRSERDALAAAEKARKEIGRADV